MAQLLIINEIKERHCDNFASLQTKSLLDPAEKVFNLAVLP